MQLVSWIAKQTGKISDRFNQYKFYVKQEPQVIDSSSTVSIHTFDSRDMTATIPCSFRWFTVRNGLTTQIHHFKGNTYICQPADVGCLLQVQIASSDPQCKGTATMTYGPVKFDILLKKEIQMALSTGQSTFVVDIGQNNLAKQCHLRVQQERITFHHISSETAFTFDYNIIQPKIEVIYKVPTKVRLVFNPKYFDSLQQFLSRLFNRHIPFQQISRNPFIEINFNNRKAKDSFVFIAKAFNTKKQLKSTAYVSNLQKQLDFTKISQKENNKNFDYLQQMSQLHKDIQKLIEINGKSYMQKRIYLEENKKLQKEIQEIVGTYVKIIQEKFQNRQDFEKSFIVLKEKQQQIKMNKDQKQTQIVHDLQVKVNLLQQQNKHLQQTIRKLNNGQPISCSPFKRKSVFEAIQSSNLAQTPSFEPTFQNQQQNVLKKQLQQMTIKYQEVKRQLQQVKNEQFKHTTDAKNKEQFNFDVFDARSVKSVKDKNHNHTQSNMQSSLLISKDTIAINPQRLKFTTHDSPSKPGSPQSSLQSYPIISCLQHQNTTLKHELSQLHIKLQSLTQQFSQKQTKYKKRISDLTEQLQMYRRNNDALNRSQHLSMEMEEYNEEQKEMLKKDNEYLRKEIENYKQLCQKYITDAKKYRQLKKENHQKSLLLQQPIM